MSDEEYTCDPGYCQSLELADHIKTLSEQLKAARDDAKEAEAYAAEMEEKLAEMYFRADRIEELEAKLALSEGALDVASKSWGECQRILEQTEAKLTKALDALQAFKDFDDFPLEMKRPDVFEQKVRRKQLRTLAELKGEDRR